MPLIVVKPGTPIVNAGTYPATLISIKPKRMVTKFSVNGEEKDFLEWTWLLETSERDVELTSLTSTETGPKSSIFAYLLALTGSRPDTGAGFEESDLVGKTVLISTIETEDGFAKIDKIVAAPKVSARVKPDAKPVEVVKAPSADIAIVGESGDDLPF